MITTVTLNPAIDKIVEINNMKLGEVHRVSNQVVSLGGKSINVARILQGFECPTKAICFAGKDNFDQVKSHAHDDQIHLVPHMVDGQTRTNVKIVEPDMDYRTTDINEAGFNISHDQLKEMTALIEEHAKESDYMVFSGSLPGGVPADYYRQLAIKLKTVTKVIIDADGEILRLGIEGSPFMIKPNIDELKSAYNRELESNESIAGLCRDIIKEHGLSYILVSMGGDGSILVGENILLRAEVLPVKVVSTVGAGDSMLAGMIFGLTKHMDSDQASCLETALSYGVASSSIAISTQDHVAIKEDELIKTAKTVTITKL